ncbi:MAG: glycosyltransferase, partial [Acidimicrobiia bacterium]|nr:glycosyltransferase [Acidimicrobiia bacterium]
MADDRRQEGPPPAQPGPAGRSVDVSVVLPCLDEVGTVGACVEKALKGLEAARVSGEVIVADNGSTDGSVEAAATSGARIVRVATRGYGHALRAGIEAANGRFIVMGDADDTYDFSDIPKFVQGWRDGYDVVMGNRFAGGIRPGAMPWTHRHVGNPLLTGLLRVLFNADIHDAHCGMRGFTAEAYRHMDVRTTGMEFASELVIKAAKLRCRMTEIPVTLWPDRRDGPPHLRSVPDGWRHLRFMLLCAPNWLFVAPGAAVMAIGVSLVLWLLPGPRKVGHVTFDVHTMFFGLIFTLLGAQAVWTGLFAKVFSYSERLSGGDQSFERLLKRFTLEQGLLVGGVVAAVGLGGDIWIFLDWRASGYGPLSAIRPLIFWSTLLFLGLQTVLSSFFL